MLSWITGSRITDVAGLDLPNTNGESFIEPPETPAPVFAVRAFKHAIFGTPKPFEETLLEPSIPRRTASKSSKLQGLDERGRKHHLPPPTARPSPPSPTKPASILMTPGTVNGRRKNVTFGKEVLDNEDKKPIQSSKTGLPNTFPGKFPSPYTPKIKTFADIDLDIGARQDGKDVGQTKSLTTPKPKPRAKDDADITIDLMEPRSQSGRYWKEHFDSYSTQSEKQVRKLIAKQKLAKDFAKNRDSEVTELKLKLESERKKYRAREKSWNEQMKDMQQRLRTAIAENSRYAAEIALLRQQLESRSAPQKDDKLSPDQKNRNPAEQQVKPDPGEPQLPGDTQSAKAGTPSSSKAPSLQPPSDPLTGSQSSIKSKDRSSHGYRVSKRPITVTTARTRTGQPFTTNAKGTDAPTASQGGNVVAILQASKQDDSVIVTSSDADLWNLSNIESSHLSHKAPSAKKSLSQPFQTEDISKPNNPTKAAAASSETSKVEAITSVAVVNTSALTAQQISKLSDTFGGESKVLAAGSEKENGEATPKHFPGTPKNRRRPLESTLANAKTSLELSREAGAKARIAARRAQKKAKGADDKGEDGGGKENGVTITA
ncbi:hypothetical protein NA57DRAFT_79782 [Rhizodiscina lignyota]|uniref:Spindle pole body-associated protein cut12 domain-containing protein n=1 Tax=Rhizodiscina lignyota TaxID=1504668 RepID=A0A9P4M341_9PEZI|nr:hypothetical protein NA57DRAFT_79782 [Rhizodiscina lignyota]